MLQELWINVTHNLFKPLLLFFYAGFLVSLLRVKFEFPKAVYQGLTIYLLLAIGWHGGEELAGLPPNAFGQALGFMVLGFFTNLLIGIITYVVLRKATKLRAIDAATVAGYYGSDSAGTFVTAMGVLTAAHIAFAPYMPVMLAVMEIPGCLVALYLVSRMRDKGMDTAGNMPGEPNYMEMKTPVKSIAAAKSHDSDEELPEWHPDAHNHESDEEPLSSGGPSRGGVMTRPRKIPQATSSRTSTISSQTGTAILERMDAESLAAKLALESSDPDIEPISETKRKFFLDPELLHEVFLNPGIFLLFAGVTIGFISRLQGEKVTAAPDFLFGNLFQGILCMFLLEMGMTAAAKLKDLRSAGWQFVAFALIAPNVFATTGMLAAHLYSLFLGTPFEIGTYVLFAVLCAAASYIALPAVQRMAIPEASPTLPLAASLGLTFSYNVTLGIPVYMMIAKQLTGMIPILSARM